VFQPEPLRTLATSDERPIRRPTGLRSRNRRITVDGSAAYSRPVIVHELSRQDARRIAVRAQLLDRERPDGLLDVVRRLTLLQVDPTAAIAPNAHLVAWSRLGSSYSRAELTQALEDHTLIELRAMIRPAEDLTLYRADMAASASRPVERDWQQDVRNWVHANDACRRDILARLDASGPLPSRELPDTCVRPWRSTGWTNNRNVTQMLECMVVWGEVAISGRQATTGCGTWPRGSTPTTTPSRPTRPGDAVTYAGCARWASLAPAPRSTPWNRSMSARWANPPSSTA